jgi:hypothetical protein
LAPNEEKKITLTIFSSDQQEVDTYSGFIEVSSGSFLKKIPIIIGVRDKKALFDIKLTIPDDKRYLYDYEKAIADIHLINMGDLKPVDVTLYYAIKNLEGEVLTFKEDTLAIYDEQTLQRIIELPRGIDNGDYILYSRVDYGNESATSADLIHITDDKKIEIEERFILDSKSFDLDLGDSMLIMKIKGLIAKGGDLNIGRIVKSKFSLIFIFVFIIVIIYLKNNLMPIQERDSLDKLNKKIEVIDYIIKAKKARKNKVEIRKNLEKKNCPKKLIDEYLK